MMSRIPPDLLLALCRIDDGLDDLIAPVYATSADRDRVAKESQGSLLAWCTEALRHEGLAPASHHRLLIEHLEKVANGQIPKLMIFMPPGSAKSKYTTELFPAWAMAHRRGISVISASHTGKLAMRFSGRVQRYVKAFSEVLGYELRTEAKERWETDSGSEYLAAGVGGAIPGYRADIAICDDPFSGREDADSGNTRDKVWEWWNGDFMPRWRPGAGVILMHTRWHEDDLAGRLLETEGDEWTVLKLPAVADSADDPLGRPIGAPLWADDAYGFAAMLLKTQADLERKGASREWASQYQQNPRPAEGALFKTGRIEVLDVAPALRGAAVGTGWDFAATRQAGTRDPDWTCRVKITRLPTGQFVVLDVFRDRGGADDVANWLLNWSTQDRMDTPGCKISIPQDPGQAGKAQVQAYTRLLAGHLIESSPETGDKATRAGPFVAQVNAGNVAIVKGAWNRAFLDELAAFPAGAKDDQVDAASRAFGLVGLAAKPVVFTAGMLAALRR
jgi:predicted phage terminase large subunit-like protein